MSSGIYLVQDGGTLVEMTEQPYATEDLLQKLLADHPSLLAGNQINPDAPRKWLLVSREVALASEQNGAGRWSVDHLFLDQDAIPTIVEVKRSSDTRIRREVVGQILEYAANAVVFWPIGDLINRFEATCSTRKQEPSEVMANFLGETEDANTFWETAGTNLQAGKLRLVFVADYIAPELQRIVEFLNEQMSPAEVLAVQIKQYVGDGFKTLIPRVIGQTAQARQKKVVHVRDEKQWNEDSFFQVIEKRSGLDDVNIAKSILDWAKSAGLIIIWGKGKTDPGFRLRVDHNDTSHALIGVWSYGSAKVGYLEVLFENLQAKPFDSESKRLEFLHRLRDIPGVEKYLHDTVGRPNVPLSIFYKEQDSQLLLETLGWAVGELRANPMSTQAE
jgi:hypothetical protein